MMNEKQKALMDDFLGHIDPEYHALFSDLANYLVDLGYTPHKNKTHDFTIDFRNARTPKTLLKMEEKEQKHDGYRCGQRGIPGLRLKFYASTAYSAIFQKGIQKVIEEFDGRYTGCYGCGDCGAQLQGYTYRYPDGTTVFRCGRELISIFNFSDQDLPEIKALLKTQADYFAKV